VHKEFKMKRVGGVAVPGSGSELVFKIAIEGLDVPALEALDQLANKFMFGSTDLAVDETQRGTTDQIKEDLF